MCKAAEKQKAGAAPAFGAHDAGIQATLLNYFTALHECDETAFRAMWHPSGLLLGLAEDGSVVSRDCETFCSSAVARGKSTALADRDAILAVHLLGDTCASAKVQIALPPAPSSPTPTTTPTMYTDWLTLLLDDGGWRIIAKVFASAPLAVADRSVTAVTPSDMHDVASAVWDGFAAA